MILEGVVLPCGVAVVTVEMRFYWNPIKSEIESQEVVVATVVDMASKTLKGKNSVA